MLEIREGTQLVLRDVGEDGESRRSPSSHSPRRFGLQLRSRGTRGAMRERIYYCKDDIIGLDERS